MSLTGFRINKYAVFKFEAKERWLRVSKLLTPSLPGRGTNRALGRDENSNGEKVNSS